MMDTILTLLNNLKRRKTVLLVLSGVVVFVTTYSLILPAITLDQEEAARQGGIDVPAQEEQAADDQLEAQTGGAADAAQGAETPQADPEEDAAGSDQDAKASSPSTEQAADVLSYEGKGYEVVLDCAEAALPDGTELVAEEISSSDEDYKAFCEDALAAVRADSRAQSGSLAFAKFYDISLLAEGEQIEPDGPVGVTISYEKALKVSDAEKVRIVHFAVDEETGEVTPEVLDAADVELRIEKNKMTETSFEAGSFSVFGIVYTVDFEYDVDGRKYTFSLPGGKMITLSELAGELGLLKGTGFENAAAFLAEVARVEFSNEELLRITETEGDWELKSIRAFTSKEVLTITMKNGNVITVKVTDAQSDAVHNADGTVQTITNPAGTTIDLFNYYVSSDTKTIANRDQWPGHIHDENDPFQFDWYNLDGTYAMSWREGWNQSETWRNQHIYGAGNNLGINKNHVFKFSPAMGGTVIDGTTGMKTSDGSGRMNSWTTDADPQQGIVQGTLSGGYPVLTNNSNLGTDGSSLAYLFDKSSQEGKDRYSDVDQLLYVDPDGYYTYDSRDFRAYYQEDGTFAVSDQPDTDDTELKGFWPFGDQVFWVGMHMNTQFSMPANGQVLNPKGEYKDMQFEFSGDDDTWLYIDGVLVGDGGGIHNRTEIIINFASGTVTVTGKKDKVHTGTFEETKYLDDLFKAAGKYKDSEWEDIGDGSGHKRLKAGTYHTFDMFYLERGGGESNLYIHYNLVSTADFTGHKAYEGFAEGERMQRDQFQFEMIGLDGQYQSVWNAETQTATVSLVDENAHAIMPTQGSEDGAGTVADPKKVYSEQAWSSANTGGTGSYIGGYIYETGVSEDGNINFGSAEINETEMHNCDEGHPSVYRYIIREIVPDDAVNENGIAWADATDAQKTQGGFVKDQIQYDGTIYYMTARVTSWEQTGADGSTYTAYGLSKTYYTDDTFTQVRDDATFVSFKNLYAPDKGEVEFIKTDGSNAPLAGAEFTLYTDKACTKIAKDLDGTEQVVTTGADGKVLLDNMAAPRTYYMKETVVPSGYEANDTVYKVTIEDAKDRTKHSRIVALDDESEREITRIVNVKPGEFSAIKEWQNQYGQEVIVSEKNVRVKVQRQHYIGGNGVTANTVRFTIRIQNRSDLVYTYTASVTGGVVTVDWWDTNQGISSFEVTDSNGNRISSYTRSDYWDDTNHKNRRVVVSNVLSDININVTYPSDKDWLFNSEHTTWMKDVSVAGNGEAAIPPELTEDTDFNDSADADHFATLSSPSWSKKWTIGGTSSSHPGYDFPASDGTNPYQYYVIEVDEDGNPLTAGEETGDGYKLKGYVTSTGVTTIVNEVTVPDTISVVIWKTDDAENSTNYLEGAVFKLEYREDSEGTFTNVSNTVVPELDADSQFTVPAEGITLTGLVDGQYQIREITPPTGYVVTESCPVQFTVSDGEITSTDGTVSDVKYSAVTELSDAAFTIPNTPGEALPAAGGRGTTWIYLLGSLLLLGCGIVLVARRRMA